MFTISRVAAALALTGLLTAQSNPPASQPAKDAPKSASRPDSTKPRMQPPHAKVSGFELAPRTAGGTQIGGATRGIGTPTTLLAPYKGRAYGLNPLFQWSNSNSRIQEYTFRLLDSSGAEVLYETKVAGTSLKYPADAPALAPGGDYFWTAQPSLGLLGEPGEPAEILLLGDPERSELESQIGKAPNLADRARMFAEQRLWYDAIETYTDMLNADADDKVARAQRAALYQQLPQTQQAAKKDLANSAK